MHFRQRLIQTFWFWGYIGRFFITLFLGGTRVALTVIQAPTSSEVGNNQDADLIAPVSPSSTLRLDSNTPSPRHHHRVTAPQPPNVSGLYLKQ